MSTWEELKEQGNSEYKKQSYNAAINCYSEAIKLNPDQDVLYANRALCHKSLNNFRQALIDIDKALGINPVNVKNLKRKAEYCVIIGNLTDAESLMQKCSNLEPREQSHR